MGLLDRIALTKHASPPPEAIDVTPANELKILWPGGREALVTSRRLREICPCAGCIEEFTGKKLLDPATIPADIRPVDGDYLLGALPGATDLGAAASGLMASALVAFGLLLGAIGLQTCSAALGHDALYRMRGEIDLTSRRLAITRLVLVGVGTAAYIASVTEIVTPGGLVSLAIAISAACVAPALAFAFWERAGDREALAALVGGAVALAAALYLAGPARKIEAYALAGLAGATVAVAAGVVSALAANKENPAAQAFVRRVLHGDGEIVAPDKGA